MKQLPQLVILPGWGGSRKTWQEFIQLAEQKFCIVCIDLPCFGEEPCPNSVWGVKEYADFIVSKLKAQNSKIILLGHSFGGQVATYIAATHPELIDKLILSGAAVIRPKNILRRATFGILAKIGKGVFTLFQLEKFSNDARAILYRGANSPDYRKTQGIRREIYKKIIREDLSHLLPTIQNPTLVLWGDKDTMTPLSHGKKITALIPNALLHTFPNMGHGLHLQCPEKFLESIQNFCT